MNVLNNSVVIICPALYVHDCNMIAALMGWGLDSFSVPLYKAGTTELTHFGLRSECDDTFIAWLRGDEMLPGIVLRNKNIKKVLNEIIVDVFPDINNPYNEWIWGADHFRKVCGDNYLSMEPYVAPTIIIDDDPIEDDVTVN